MLDTFWACLQNELLQLSVIEKRLGRDEGALAHKCDVDVLAQGAQYIASILVRAPLMEDLRMASSRVGPEGGIALAQALCTGRPAHGSPNQASAVSFLPPSVERGVHFQLSENQVHSCVHLNVSDGCWQAV